MDTVCEDKMALEMARLGGLGIIHRNQSIDRQSAQLVKVLKKQLPVGVAIGIGEDAKERLNVLVKAGAKLVCIDASHGHTKIVIDLVKYIKEKYQVEIIAGNVATYDGACALYEAGADVLRVGKGAGSICITRIVSGIGVPQLTAVIETSRAAKKFGRTLIADGGIRAGGDIVKALAANASAVMLGSMLAATDEAPGLLVKEGKETYKIYRGMGSVKSMRLGSADRYRQENKLKDRKNLVPEGVEGKVKFKGKLKPFLSKLEEGIKSGMYSVGAQDLTQLSQRATFVRITPPGLVESLPHDIYGVN